MNTMNAHPTPLHIQLHTCSSPPITSIDGLTSTLVTDWSLVMFVVCKYRLIKYRQTAIQSLSSLIWSQKSTPRQSPFIPIFMSRTQQSVDHLLFGSNYTIIPTETQASYLMYSSLSFLYFGYLSLNT